MVWNGEHIAAVPYTSIPQLDLEAQFLVFNGRAHDVEGPCLEDLPGFDDVPLEIVDIIELAFLLADGSEVLPEICPHLLRGENDWLQTPELVEAADYILMLEEDEVGLCLPLSHHPNDPTGSIDEEVIIPYTEQGGRVVAPTLPPGFIFLALRALLPSLFTDIRGRPCA